MKLRVFTPLENPVFRGSWDKYKLIPFLERVVSFVRDSVSNGIGCEGQPFLTGFTFEKKYYERKAIVTIDKEVYSQRKSSDPPRRFKS